MVDSLRSKSALTTYTMMTSQYDSNICKNKLGTPPGSKIGRQDRQEKQAHATKLATIEANLDNRPV